METPPFLSPRFIFSFRNLSLLLSVVDYNRLSPHPLLLRSYVVFSTVAPAFTFPFVFFTSRMGRRRTAEDYQRTTEENSWDLGANKEEDSLQ